MNGFTRPPNPVGADLGPHLSLALGKALQASVTPDDVLVEGATETDRGAIQSALDAYVYDPVKCQAIEDDKLPAEARALRVYSALKTWSSDAQGVSDGWATMTAGQKDAVFRTVIQRFGTLCDRMADLLRYLTLD